MILLLVGLCSGICSEPDYKLDSTPQGEDCTSYHSSITTYCRCDQEYYTNGRLYTNPVDGSLMIKGDIMCQQMDRLNVAWGYWTECCCKVTGKCEIYPGPHGVYDLKSNAHPLVNCGTFDMFFDSYIDFINSGPHYRNEPC